MIYSNHPVQIPDSKYPVDIRREECGEIPAESPREGLLYALTQ